MYEAELKMVGKQQHTTTIQNCNLISIIFYRRRCFLAKNFDHSTFKFLIADLTIFVLICFLEYLVPNNLKISAHFWLKHFAHLFFGDLASLASKILKTVFRFFFVLALAPFYAAVRNSDISISPSWLVSTESSMSSKYS
jgi:hypothetical protein